MSQRHRKVKPATSEITSPFTADVSGAGAVATTKDGIILPLGNIPKRTYNYSPPLANAILPLLEFFQSISVEGEILKQFEDAHGDFKQLMEVSKDLNAVVFAQLIDDASMEEVEDEYKQAYINWLKLNLLLFTTNPYWRSRIGHMMWHFVCANDPNSYTPLAWEEHFDPTQWYRIGEAQRAADNHKVSAFSLPD